MRNFGRSSILGKAATERSLRGISAQNLTGAVRYFDALTNDARLVVDTLRSAAKHGACVANYVWLKEANCSEEMWRCTLTDVESGQSFDVMTRTIVNATGPWSDKLAHSHTSLRLTKGVHLVIDRNRLPVPDAVVMTEGDRILFAIPWGERLILGTTDTDYSGSLSNPVCDDEDVRYVLDVTNGAFPAAKLTTSDVISTWAGLRPLVADPNGKPSDISRRHEVKMHEPGWWDVTGGKLTTYRLMAEEAVDQITRFLGLRAECRTAAVPLLEPSGTSGMSGIIPPPVSEAVVKHYCQDEWVRRLEDLMIRRTSWRHYRQDHLEVAASAVRWMAGELGWDEARANNELQEYRSHVGGNGAAAPHVSMGNGRIAPRAQAEAQSAN
jgi:glycerol-3-phosphate dehydrogenase